jgi:hypothetical protein
MMRHTLVTLREGNISPIGERGSAMLPRRPLPLFYRRTDAAAVNAIANRSLVRCSAIPNAA